jgi:hypothetical protein
VAIVSSSLNALGTAKGPAEIQKLASAADKAELDEDSRRAVLNAAAGDSAATANQKILDNTPIVLKGLESIVADPSPANAAKELAVIESARY